MYSSKNTAKTLTNNKASQHTTHSENNTEHGILKKRGYTAHINSTQLIHTAQSIQHITISTLTKNKLEHKIITYNLKKMFQQRLNYEHFLFFQHLLDY